MCGLGGRCRSGGGEWLVLVGILWVVGGKSEVVGELDLQRCDEILGQKSDGWEMCGMQQGLGVGRCHFG